MTETLRVLMIEDDPDDATLVQREFRRAGVLAEFRTVAHETDLIEALTDRWSVVLCDFTLPGWDGLAALAQVRHRAGDTPFIFVSGSIGEDVAVAAMRAGADDYLLKGNLHRLLPAVLREVRSHEDRDRAREAERVRAVAEMRYGQVMETAADAIISVDGDQIVRAFNRGAERIFGYRSDELLGRPLDRLIPHRYRRRHRDHVAAFLTAEGQAVRHTDVTARRKDGSEFPAQITLSLAGVGDERVATAILRDVTVLKRSQEHIRFLAHFDPLTHLPNRILFRERLESACAEAQRKGRRVAVAILDLDRFKAVNDSRGHRVGDQLLTAVAARLKGCVRADDTVARLGGDEFGIVLADLASGSDCGHVAESITAALHHPFRSEGGTIGSTASLGLTLFPDDATDLDSLLVNADLAMYRAKRQGGDCFEFYRPEMTARERDRAELEEALRNALRRNGLGLQFQPQVEVRSGRLIGCEALARWRHPARGLVAPALFVRIAEEAGLMSRLGGCVLRLAASAAAAWPGSDRRDYGSLSVNVSAFELMQPDYADRVLQILAEEGLPPARLQLEVTEGLLRHAEEKSVLSTLQHLERAGVGLAIDDFGTGYSNLSRLRQLPFRTLKIDRSLIADLPGDSEARAIAAAVITMARQLGLQTVAEGVERSEQQQILEYLGCDVLQGFLISEPLWDREWRRFADGAATGPSRWRPVATGRRRHRSPSDTG